METVLREAGDCGRFQGCHVLFTQLPRFAIVWAVFLMMYGSYDPGWKCVRIQNNSSSELINASHFLHGNATTTTPPIYDKIGSRDATNLYKNASFSLNTNVTARKDKANDINGDSSVPPLKTSSGVCEGIDSCQKIEFSTTSVTVVSQFELICENAWKVRGIFIFQGVGYFLGALLSGQIGEKFGRKIGLYSSTLIVCVFSGLAIFSVHWIMYAVCIFFIGLGANGVICLTSVFSVEFLNSKWRGYFGSLPTWNVSLLLFTLTTFAMKSWVYLHLVTFVMTFVSCLGFLIVVESPRWLIMNGRPEKAEKAIRKIARINGKPPPNLDRLLQLQADQKEDVDYKEGKSYTYLDLFRTTAIRSDALRLSLLMGIFGVVYYSFGWGIQTLPGDFYVNAVLSSVIEIINLVFVGPLCNRVGRRIAGVFMALLGAISCLSIVIALFAVEEGTVQSTIIKAFAFQGKGAAQATFSITSLFIVELLPTVVRNVGIGFCRCVAGMGTLLAPFLIPSSDIISFAVCFAILCVFYIIDLALFLSLPETNNLDLKDGLIQVRNPVVPPTDPMDEMEENKKPQPDELL